MLLEPGTLLQKAHEGCDPCARSDHHHRVAGLKGEPKLGLPHIQRDRSFVAVVHHSLVFQPVGGHALECASSAGAKLHHHGADANRCGVHLKNGSLVSIS